MSSFIHVMFCPRSNQIVKTLIGLPPGPETKPKHAEGAFIVEIVATLRISSNILLTTYKGVSEV
jgi:hypothetical protein